MNRKPAKFVSLGNERLSIMQQGVLEQSEEQQAALEASACHFECGFKEIERLDISLDPVLFAVKNSENVVTGEVLRVGNELLSDIARLNMKHDIMLRGFETRHNEAQQWVTDVKRKLVLSEENFAKKIAASELTLDKRISDEVSNIQVTIAHAQKILVRICLCACFLQVVQLIWMLTK